MTHWFRNFNFKPLDYDIYWVVITGAIGTGGAPDLIGIGSSRILALHLPSRCLGLIRLVSTMQDVGDGVAVIARWPSYLLIYNVFENSNFALFF